LSLERRADPLLAFANLWPQWSHTPTARHFCLRSFLDEAHLCAQTKQTDDTFTQPLNTNVLKKSLQVLDLTYGPQHLVTRRQSLPRKMLPACVAAACVYYADFIVNVCANPSPNGSASLDSALQELSLILQGLNANFDPIVASGDLYLIERIPVWAPLQMNELFNSVLNLAKCDEINAVILLTALAH
jgi:hypothetical protein